MSSAFPSSGSRKVVSGSGSPAAVPMCGFGSVYSPQTGSCVPVATTPVQNPCDFASPFVCSAPQWVQFQGMTPAQFLSWDTPGCLLGARW
jgi:hypothetical protein